MTYPHGIREEELKNRVAADWFAAFDCSFIADCIVWTLCTSCQRFTNTVF